MGRSPNITSRSKARSKNLFHPDQSNNPLVKKFKTPYDKFGTPEQGTPSSARPIG